MKDESLKHKTTKGLLWSGGSNIIQQFLGVLFGIFLARILSLDDYGMIGMITIFSVIASALQESGFVNGIANLDDVSDRDYNAVFWCSVTVASVLYILFFFLSPLIAAFYDIPELTLLARISFLSFWAASFGVAHNAFLFRNLMVRERSISTLFATVISGISGVVMAMQGWGYWGIAIQVVCYSLTNSILVTIFSKFKPTFKIDFRPVFRILRYSSRILITNIFIHINNHVFGLILGRYDTATVVGSVTQANKWNMMAQSVISGMANSVVQPVMKELMDDHHRQKRIFRKITEFTACISFPSLFTLALLSEDFIIITISEKWIDSAYFLKILSFGGAFAIVSTVLSNYLLSRGKSSIYMWAVISFGILQIFSFLILHSYGAIFMILSTAILQFLWLFVWYTQVKRYINYSFIEMLSDIFSYALLAIVSIAVASPLLFMVENIYIRFIFSIVVVCLVYTLLNLLFKPTVIRELYSFMFKKVLK